jgi:regulatory LuxR family protein
MMEKAVQLSPREQQIVSLLLEGCENDEIARRLSMARRTVKAHFNRLFLRFGISGGIKRVKLATLLYRRQLCLEANATEPEFQASASSRSLNSLPGDSRIVKSPRPSEPQNTSLRTTSASSTTSSDSGTASNLPSGTKHAEQKPHTPDLPEAWEVDIRALIASLSSNH